MNEITVREAAELLDVDPTTITRAIKDGRLHPVRENSGIVKRKKYFLSWEEVAQYATKDQIAKYRASHSLAIAV